ncbi:MAG: hypothetical protein MUC71_08735 [Steroidobacteraceae bacterium]|nr:hypothetical protein [Steroidobacteraceae bacterium]
MGSGKLLELLLVIGLVLGFGLRELWILRRDRKSGDSDHDDSRGPDA